MKYIYLKTTNKVLSTTLAQTLQKLKCFYGFLFSNVLKKNWRSKQVWRKYDSNSHVKLQKCRKKVSQIEGLKIKTKFGTCITTNATTENAISIGSTILIYKDTE